MSPRLTESLKILVQIHVLQAPLPSRKGLDIKKDQQDPEFPFGNCQGQIVEKGLCPSLPSSGSLLWVFCALQKSSVPLPWQVLGTPTPSGDSQALLQPQSNCMWEAQAPQQELFGCRPEGSRGVTGKMTFPHISTPGCRVREYLTEERSFRRRGVPVLETEAVG